MVYQTNIINLCLTNPNVSNIIATQDIDSLKQIMANDVVINYGNNKNNNNTNNDILQIDGTQKVESSYFHLCTCSHI